MAISLTWPDCFSFFICSGGKSLEQFTGTTGIYTPISVNCVTSHYIGNIRLLLKKDHVSLVDTPCGNGES